MKTTGLPRELSVGPTPPVPVTASELYHATVQPCFDRKIESARPNFSPAGANNSDIGTGDCTRDVDTVLTTTELLEILRGAAGSSALETEGSVVDDEIFASVSPLSIDGEVLTDLCLGSLADRPAPLLCNVGANAGSGGFLEHVFREAAAEIYGSRTNAPLEFHILQNQDMREVVLRDQTTNQVQLRFVAAYGFRNIQNIIRRITKGRSQAGKDCGDFVEIMACPGGCLNGGGQIPSGKRPGVASDRNEHLGKLEALIHDSDTAVVAPAAHPLIPALYNYIACQSDVKSEVSSSWDRLIGSDLVRRWLSAEWRSLKVDSEGKEVVGTSAFKW